MRKTDQSIVYFLTRSMFLGFGIALLLQKSGKDSYIGAILGTFIGLIFISLYNYILKKKKDKTLKELMDKDKTVGFISRILMIGASLIILLYVLVIYKIFVVSFLLVNSPEIFVTIPILLLATFAVFKGFKVISRLAGALLPLSLILTFLIILGLGGYVEGANFLPILANTPSSVLKTALIFAGVSTFPNILILNMKGEIKGIYKMYIGAAISLVIVLLFVEGVLGEALVSILRFPEYMVLKQIKLFNFIEKVENVLATVWLLDLFVAIVMAIFSLKELLPEKNNKCWTWGILISLVFVIDRFLAFDYVNELRIYYIFPYIALIIPLIVIAPLLYLVHKKKPISE